MAYYDRKLGKNRQYVEFVDILLDQNNVVHAPAFAKQYPDSYNTPKTTEGTVTVDGVVIDAFSSNNPKKIYRFSDQHLPNASFPSFAKLRSAKATTPILKIGENIGSRASCTVNVDDFITTDVYELPSSYSNRRVTQSFWGKAEERNYIEKREMHVYRGYLTEEGDFDITNFQVEVYIIESFSREKNGSATIKGVDPLYYTNESKAKMPLKSKGELDLPLDATTIGNILILDAKTLEYGEIGTSGVLRIDDEFLSYIVIADSPISTPDTSNITIEITARGYQNSVVAEHDAEALCQKCYISSNKNVIDVIKDALEFTKIDPKYFPLEQWEAEKIGNLSIYTVTTILSKPTEVKKIISEMIRHSGAIMFWDTVMSQITIKGVPEFGITDLVVDESIYEQDSISIKRLKNNQITRQSVNFAKRNYVLDDKENNYARGFSYIDDLAESPAQFDDISEGKVINSNWLTNSVSDAGIVSRIATREVQRKAKVPFETEFEIDSEYIGFQSNTADLEEFNSFSDAFSNEFGLTSSGWANGWSNGFGPLSSNLQDTIPRVWLGSVIEMTNHIKLGANGKPLTYKGQITKMQPTGMSKWKVTILSISPDVVSEDDIDVFVENGTYENENLFDIITGTIPTDRMAVIGIREDVKIGSTSTSNAALIVDPLNFPFGFKLINRGAVMGEGGKGGNGGDLNSPSGEPVPFCETSMRGLSFGNDGGVAIEFLSPSNGAVFTISNTFGRIFAGGGGGAGQISWDGVTSNNKPSKTIGAGGGGAQGYTGGEGGDAGNVSNVFSQKGDDGTQDSAGQQVSKGGEWGEDGQNIDMYPCNSLSNKLTVIGGTAGAAIVKNGNQVFFTDGQDPVSVRGAIID